MVPMEGAKPPAEIEATSDRRGAMAKVRDPPFPGEKSSGLLLVDFATALADSAQSDVASVQAASSQWAGRQEVMALAGASWQPLGLSDEIHFWHSRSLSKESG